MYRLLFFLLVFKQWRGKPVFIRHRTASEIEEANKVDMKSLRDPEADSDRVQKRECHFHFRCSDVVHQQHRPRILIVWFADL